MEILTIIITVYLYMSCIKNQTNMSSVNLRDHQVHQGSNHLPCIQDKTMQLSLEFFVMNKLNNILNILVSRLPFMRVEKSDSL